MKLKLEGTDEEYELASGTELARALDAQNSPLLFGCRTGICGTCLVQVVQGEAADFIANEDEQELLEIIDRGLGKTRLACQMKINNDLVLKYIGKK